MVHKKNYHIISFKAFSNNNFIKQIWEKNPQARG